MFILNCYQLAQNKTSHNKITGGGIFTTEGWRLQARK